MPQKFKKRIGWIICGLWVSSAFLQVVSPGQMLERYFSAIGQEQLERIPSLFIKGKFVPASGEDLYFKMYVRDRDKLHVEWAGNGTRWTEIYNQGQAWKLESGVATPADAQVLFNLSLLVKLTSPLQGLAAERLEPGETKVDGQPYHSLELQLDEEKIEFLFDKENYLLVFQRVSVSDNSRLIPQEIEYRKYRDLSGVKIAFAYTIKTNTTTADLIFDELVLGYPAPASLFQPPQ